MSTIKVALEGVADLIGRIKEQMDSEKARLIAAAPAVRGQAKRDAIANAIHRLELASRTSLTQHAIADVIAAAEDAEEYEYDNSDWVIATYRLVDVVLGLMSRDLVDPDTYLALTAHVASVLGRLYPDDPEVAL